jgi:hypothetical protein
MNELLRYTASLALLLAGVQVFDATDFINADNILQGYIFWLE